ncbi:MAG: hypothetical protein ACREL3_13150 [Gemmatimonadales bacterium]
MITLVRVVALAALLVPAASAHASPNSLPATAARDTATLQFHDFRAGARLQEIDGVLRRSGGGGLRCDRAKADRRVTECRAVVQLADLGGPVDVWLSAVDSVASVITLSGDGAGGQIDRWRRAIERRYGMVGAQVQGPQWMMQWVRQGRMLRLTWRTDRNQRPVSVSLVDGRVLDAWGRARSKFAKNPS